MSSTNLLHICFVVFLCLTACNTTERTIPEYLHICKESDPDGAGCVRKSIEIIRPALVDGIPSLGIPSVDPLRIGNLLVSESTASNGLQITAKDILSYGASDFIIKNLNVVEFGKTYNVEVFYKKMRVNGTYVVDGQVLLLPIKGSGPFTGNFYDSTGTVRLQFGRKKINGEDFVHIKKFDIKIKVGKGSIKLYNLFNGDKALGDALNVVINDNFDVLSKDIIPLVEKALERVLKRIATKITENFTYDQVFPK